MMSMYVDVLLPLPLRMLFTYTVPVELQSFVREGQRVAVPFGKSKIYAALVRNISWKEDVFSKDDVPSSDIKAILSVLDQEPIVNHRQFTFWEWMAGYYLCTEGDVMAAALPSGFKLDSETRLILNPSFDGDISGLNERQLDLLSALSSHGELTMEQASQVTSVAKVFPMVKSLRERGIVLVKEEFADRYRPLQETYLRWGDGYWNNEEQQQQLFSALEKKKSSRQMELLMAYISLFPHAKDGWVRKSVLAEKAGKAQDSIPSLVKKGVLESRKFYKSRLEAAGEILSRIQELPQLSPAQQEALDKIEAGFSSKPVCLLHGVTSSGKTEIYIHLIRKTLDQGKQVLFLLPEIALSAQMISRLRKYFGDEVGVYHSRYNEPEKVEIWKNVGKKYQLVLGARSALFLPYDNLGLIIVDEEHESSYKQQDPAPRYNARDAAIFLAHLHGARTLLGSATPSVETYYNAIHGKYALSTLFTRYGNVQLPTVLVANLKEEKKQKLMQGNFASSLISRIGKALEEKKQVILFQNRRGFSARLECEVCSYIPVCDHCDVTLTYHKHQGVLLCHYCGHSKPQMHVCPQCGNTSMRLKGFGTERVEEDLALIFPQARIGRMDLDTTRAKGSYHRIIDDFENRRIDILVGTQMVTKGLDFDNVALVGIIDADSLISFPDFRAYERSFQLMTQVSGRAGRKGGGGEVVIQTYNPDYQVIKDVMNTDYVSMYQHQIQDRLAFRYPPFFRMLKLSLRHKDETLVQEAAVALAERMRQIYGERVLGPDYPLVSRINTYYIRDIVLKMERGALVEPMKRRLVECIDDFRKESRYVPVRIVVDVDPQ